MLRREGRLRNKGKGRDVKEGEEGEGGKCG
jgi:hypothetical protein